MTYMMKFTRLNSCLRRNDILYTNFTFWYIILHFEI